MSSRYPPAPPRRPARSRQASRLRSAATGALLAALIACGTPSPPVPPEDTPPAAEATEPAPDTSPPAWRSSLYPASWTPADTDAEGRFLHDFSYAGYHAGEAPLPTTLPSPQVSVLDHGADPTGALDSTAAIQAAIDAVSAGGTVWLPAGRYVVDGALTVRASGVVITGDGADATFVHFRKSTGQSGGAGLLFQGRAPTAGAWPLADDAAARADVVRVVDPAGLAVGDAVSVGWTITDAFIADHGMTGTWTAFTHQHRPFFRRTITAIDGDRVHLDVPIRYPAARRDLAELRRDDGYLTEVGLQDLAVSSRVDEAAAWSADRHHAIELARVADAWVQRIATFDPEGDGGAHLQSGGLLIANSRRVTVADSALCCAQHNGSGGNGYLVEVMQTNEVLVRDTVAHSGRHNFIQNWDFSTSGTVWLRTTSTGGRADNGLLTVVGASEFHHSLAMANLIDSSFTDDGWACLNRGAESSGAGHAGTQNVFWNVTGPGLLRSAQYGWGYVIGTSPDLRVVTDPSALELLLGGAGTAPADFVEGLGAAATLEPASLYEDQLRRRLGR
jgi:hypothetical protein